MSIRKLYDKLIISYSTSYQISIVGQRYFRKGNSSTAQQCFIHLVNPNPAQAAALSTKTNFSDSKIPMGRWQNSKCLPKETPEAHVIIVLSL